ncbi:hypothetical protein NIES2107_74990 (plasmid) [Nostoc carneum NIES-2107]|nr:hypothetical protein NIES2107_74990 [Nostoc carneum NIES-2107]
MINFIGIFLCVSAEFLGLVQLASAIEDTAFHSFIFQDLALFYVQTWQLGDNYTSDLR